MLWVPGLCGSCLLPVWFGSIRDFAKGVGRLCAALGELRSEDDRARLRWLADVPTNVGADVFVAGLRSADKTKTSQLPVDCGGLDVGVEERANVTPLRPGILGLCGSCRLPVWFGSMARKVGAPPRRPAEQGGKIVRSCKPGLARRNLRTWRQKIVYTSRFVRVILAQGPC